MLKQVLLILILLVLISWLIIPSLSGSGDASNAAADVQIDVFENVIQMFREQNGRIPTEEEGLQVLIGKSESWAEHTDKARLLYAVPFDPWGNEFVYFHSDAHETGYGIYSKGKDGMTDSMGNDSDDINSWRVTGL